MPNSRIRVKDGEPFESEDVLTLEKEANSSFLSEKYKPFWEDWCAKQLFFYCQFDKIGYFCLC